MISASLSRAKTNKIWLNNEEIREKFYHPHSTVTKKLYTNKASDAS